MIFPPYAKYKESGVEWLGQVPMHWDVNSFKWQIERNDGGVWGDDPDGIDDTIVLRSTEQTADGRWRMDNPAPRKLSVAEKESALLAESDLVVTKSSGSSLHIGKTTIVTPEISAMGCCYSNFMQRVRMKSTFSPKLAWHILNNDIARLQFDLLSNSTTGLANLNGTMIGQILLAVPPRNEQDKMVDFLDHGTTKIDALIEEQKRLIELLKEKRQTVISQAITKGLDPNARMKDSGVEWLGQIPAHWDAVSLKRISPAQTVGIVVNPSLYVAAEGLPYIYGGDIREGWIDLNGCRKISHEDSERNAKTRLMADDLLTVRVGAPGVTAVVPQDAEDGNCASVMLIRRGEFDSRWLCYTMNDRIVRFQVEVVQYGAAQEQFNISHAVEFKLPRPSRTEQTSIADHLDIQTSKLDKLVAEAEAAIKLLGERRTALISAAVTGKIDVRGFVAKKPTKLLEAA